MLPGTPVIERIRDTPRTWHSRTLNGCFSGAMVSLSVDRRSLERTLPPGLTTDTARYADRHPLLLLVGTQRAVHPVVFGFRLQFSAMREYREACVIVPDVVPAEGPGTDSQARRTYFARLYLDRIAPTLYGRWPYGWNKCLARFTEQENRVRIERRRKGRLLELTTAHVMNTGQRCEIGAFDRTAAYLDRPAIVGQKRVDRPSRLRFAWHTADISPVHAALTIGQRLLIGLDPQHRTTNGATDNGCQAFQVRVDWSLETGLPETVAGVDRSSDSLLQPVRNSA